MGDREKAERNYCRRYPLSWIRFNGSGGVDFSRGFDKIQNTYWTGQNVDEGRKSDICKTRRGECWRACASDPRWRPWNFGKNNPVVNNVNVTGTSNVNNADANNVTGAGEDSYVQEILGQLQKQQHHQEIGLTPGLAETKQGKNSVSDNLSWQDPQIYIKCLGQSDANKFHDIADFVSASGANFNDETLLSHSSNGKSIGVCRVHISSDGIQTFPIFKRFFLSPRCHATESLNHHPINLMGNLFLTLHQTRRYSKNLIHVKVALFQHANLSTLAINQAVVNCTLGLLMHTLIQKLANLVKPLCDLDHANWEIELENDFDKEFLLHDIQFGFDIVDTESLPVDISAKNHPSASPGSPLYQKAHLQILNEIECGNYVLAKSPPRIISPLGVILKPDGGFRLIHDCSRPDGMAANDFIKIPLVPLTDINLARYIAFLSGRLCFKSIQNNYLSVISLLHKEAGISGITKKSKRHHLQPFFKKSSVEKELAILQWILGDEKGRTVFDDKEKVFLNEVQDIAFSSALIDDSVDLLNVEKFFTKDAMIDVMSEVMRIKENSFHKCSSCTMDLNFKTNVVKCSSCLGWNHLPCVFLKTVPKAKHWYCKRCKQINK
ncbi:unnamed protein product [Mytilus coruscus]|uniref:PHD-type domain-containing protein n=1 Tax=Mytilus coruscus TaxID=42192 RepID=A0A6J8AGY0_MYTCO|nr:unnamed protein product [Mytilus coruscus]